MLFRCARHSQNLVDIETFYTQIVGLDILSRFTDHDGYNGIFLGHKGSNWHLEFTSSRHRSNAKHDLDDAFVFYLSSQVELDLIIHKLRQKDIPLKHPRNPYWTAHGTMVEDPDGYPIIFTIKHHTLDAQDALTGSIKSMGINTWSHLVSFIQNLPYGRNKNRWDLSLVLQELQGSCSSKHALLKKVADLNGIDNVKLILGIYKMNHINTPNIGDTLLDNGLSYIPEAHCYLRINNRTIDITSTSSHLVELSDIIQEQEITPESIDIFKVEQHQQFIKNWAKSQNLNYNFEQIWDIRERCIQKLSEKS